jgi:hypothetical protein
VNCPFIYRYIPAAPTYDVYVLELVFPIMILKRKCLKIPKNEVARSCSSQIVNTMVKKEKQTSNGRQNITQETEE